MAHIFIEEIAFERQKLFLRPPWSLGQAAFGSTGNARFSISSDPSHLGFVQSALSAGRSSGWAGSTVVD